jgi:hypothetical protein
VQGNIRHGFVYERVPHITLKSIANNAEIDVIWERWQSELEPFRGKLNAALKKQWQERTWRRRFSSSESPFAAAIAAGEACLSGGAAAGACWATAGTPATASPNARLAADNILERRFIQFS